MWTSAFWKAAAERALKSGAQFVLLTIFAGVAAGTGGDQSQIINAFLLDWQTLAGVFAGGIVVSVLTSLVTAGATDGNPSLVNAEVLSPPAPQTHPDDDGPDHRAGN